MVNVRIDTREAELALRQLATMSKRTYPEIVNKSLMFIGRGATRLTPKAKASEIRASLNQEIMRGPPGRTLPMKLSEAIVRARLNRKGEMQPDKASIKQLVKQMVAARMRSIAYIKSGWLPAIARLGAILGIAPRGQGNQYGKPKGSADPAKPGWKVVGRITNEAYTRHDPKALELYGAPALQQAVDDEAAKTRAEIEKRMSQDLTQLGIKHHG